MPHPPVFSKKRKKKERKEKHMAERSYTTADGIPEKQVWFQDPLQRDETVWRANNCETVQKQHSTKEGRSTLSSTPSPKHADLCSDQQRSSTECFA